MSGGVEYQPITSCPEPKPSCLPELRQEWGAERKTLKQVFFFFGANLEILHGHLSFSTKQVLPRQVHTWTAAVSTAPGTA